MFGSEIENESKDTVLLKLMAKQVVDHLDLSQITQKSQLEIEKLVRAEFKKHSRTVEVRNLDANTGKNMGVQHKQFETLLKCLTARTHVYVVGPAGSGKTVAAEKCAAALDLQFGCMSVGPQSTQSHIMGYMDATGKYVETEFRRRYEQGGVFLFDEIDAGNPAVLTCINSAIANDVCSFADKMVPKHKDFLIIASGNTFGRGANRDYVGRNQLDAATLDRFVVIDWDYDEELERNLVSNTAWVNSVQATRAAVEELKVRMIVSPRASIYGAQLLAAGLTEDVVEEMVIWKGVDPETVTKVKNKIADNVKKKPRTAAA